LAASIATSRPTPSRAKVRNCSCVMTRRDMPTMASDEEIAPSLNRRYNAGKSSRWDRSPVAPMITMATGSGVCALGWFIVRCPFLPALCPSAPGAGRASFDPVPGACYHPHWPGRCGLARGLPGQLGRLLGSQVLAAEEVAGQVAFQQVADLLNPLRVSRPPLRDPGLVHPVGP